MSIWQLKMGVWADGSAEVEQYFGFFALLGSAEKLYVLVSELMFFSFAKNREVGSLQT